jgi:aminoglycoside/choline kinase family phosphotransferase
LTSWEKLFGEASYREYFRIRTDAEKTYVVMKIPKGKMSVSEEITNYQGPKDELPFLNIARFLRSRGIPAPQVLQVDLENGLVLLQDLGDKTLEKLLPDCNEGMRFFFYKQAVDLLLQWQKAGESQDPSCIAFHRSFDLRLLTWEFDHFLEYGIEDRFGIRIPDEEKKQIQAAALDLIRPITEIPYGLTHRDFQSRNLMLHGYQFHLIDFQDALLGPPQYDLVALLRDSYIVLPFAFWKSLLEYYLAAREKAALTPIDSGKFVTGFHRITIQRKLKDAGRFQYIHTVKKNANFLPHVPASLEYVKQAFALLPEAKALQEMLAKYVPELR